MKLKILNNPEIVKLLTILDGWKDGNKPMLDSAFIFDDFIDHLERYEKERRLIKNKPIPPYSKRENIWEKPYLYIDDPYLFNEESSFPKRRRLRQIKGHKSVEYPKKKNILLEDIRMSFIKEESFDRVFTIKSIGGLNGLTRHFLKDIRPDLPSDTDMRSVESLSLNFFLDIIRK
jgi:hypothetical protein